MYQEKVLDNNLLRYRIVKSSPTASDLTLTMTQKLSNLELDACDILEMMYCPTFGCKLHGWSHK